MTKIIIKPSDAEVQQQVARGTRPTLQQELQQERMLRAATANVQRTGETIGVDFANFDWPSGPYGHDHAQQTSMLAAHILGFLEQETPGLVKPRDYEIVRALGLFHDLGRREDWRRPDPEHAQRSAAIAEGLMVRDAQRWAERETREEICRLVAAHGLDKQPPNDPRLIALWDAECLESARFSPGTIEGMEIMRRRMGQVITRWAKLEEHQRRWRERRGWK